MKVLKITVEYANRVEEHFCPVQNGVSLASIQLETRNFVSIKDINGKNIIINCRNLVMATEEEINVQVDSREAA